MKEDKEEKQLEEISRKGGLTDYVDVHTVNFGEIKALFTDALRYKEKREFIKGVAQFALRAIPILLAPIWFPVWLISQILGDTRAIDKVIVPFLMLSHKDHHSELSVIIKRVMGVAEGDIKPFLGNDWFYDVFCTHGNLIGMIRQEHIINFANYISDVMKNKPDDEVVPKYWLDNEFRQWLNKNFEINLPMLK
jgi:hypothetical protein